VWIGDKDVSVTGDHRGFELHAGEYLSFDASQFNRASIGEMWAIAESAQTVELEILAVVTGAL
jgi:uncharacterized protein YaiE (UPF0345 family)